MNKQYWLIFLLLLSVCSCERKGIKIESFPMEIARDEIPEIDPNNLITDYVEKPGIVIGKIDMRLLDTDKNIIKPKSSMLLFKDSYSREETEVKMDADGIYQLSIDRTTNIYLRSIKIKYSTNGKEKSRIIDLTANGLDRNLNAWVEVDKIDNMGIIRFEESNENINLLFNNKYYEIERNRKYLEYADSYSKNRKCEWRE